MSLQSLHSIVQPGERGLLESIFVGYVQLTAESPYPIIVYSVANYRPHLRDTSQQSFTAHFPIFKNFVTPIIRKRGGGEGILMTIENGTPL